MSSPRRIGKLRKAIGKLDAAVHVIAPAGGVLKRGNSKQIVERTLLSARSADS
jgi:catalase